jgi:hypothetical protein
MGLALGNALDGEKQYRRWIWEAMGDLGLALDGDNPRGIKESSTLLVHNTKTNKIQDQQENF